MSVSREINVRAHSPQVLSRSDNANQTDSWDVLEHFLRELQSSARSVRQSRLLLQAVGDGLRADAVFLHSGADDTVELTGHHELTPDWCRRFVSGLVRGLPAGTNRAFRSEPDALAHAGAPVPHSAAVVQVSRSKRVWAVSLSFSPRRLFDAGDVKVMWLARRMLSYHFQQLYAAEELKNTLLGLVYCLTATLDAKDAYTCGHSERVARIAVRLGRQMRLTEAQLSDMYLAGLLHDVGKIGIRDSVLQKPGKLTAEEMLHVQEHAVIGDRIISNVRQLAHLRPGVRSHHERWDGRGYPDCLAGSDIPLMARIIAVADGCDAMMSPRPYRPAMPQRLIDEVMRAGAGSQWDPDVVGHFLECRAELYTICERGIGESVCTAVERAVQARHDPSGDSSECSFGAEPHLAAAP
jgi:HD-GYP domain-containing protein (c-di-GMP phosphodiesterase class II)